MCSVLCNVLHVRNVVCRLQGAEPAADGGAQVAGVVARPGRVPAVRDDVRQLPQAARLQQRRGDARQAAAGGLRGPALLPPVVSARPRPSASPRTLIRVLYSKCASDDRRLCAIRVNYATDTESAVRSIVSFS